MLGMLGNEQNWDVASGVFEECISRHFLEFNQIFLFRLPDRQKEKNMKSVYMKINLY